MEPSKLADIAELYRHMGTQMPVNNTMYVTPQMEPVPLCGQEVNGYYLDLSQPPIGGRPVRQSHNQTNQVPVIMTKATTQNMKRRFNCRGPEWDPSCM